MSFGDLYEMIAEDLYSLIIVHFNKETKQKYYERFKEKLILLNNAFGKEEILLRDSNIFEEYLSETAKKQETAMDFLDKLEQHINEMES